MHDQVISILDYIVIKVKACAKIRVAASYASISYLAQCTMSQNLS